jgi:CheY-like chemotaxis protein
VVRLPALPAAARVGEDGAAAGLPRAAGTGRRVLVVDDNKDAARSLALLLETVGHDTRVCLDGASALEAAEEYRPQVVLLDIGLPGLDGYEVARQMRGRPATAGALLVALTGYGQESDQRRAFEAGFDRHLVKPADLSALASVLESRTAAGDVA